MRRFWAAVVAACALASTARADDHWSDPPVGEVAETVEALASPDARASTDDARRREAVETLAKYGPDVLADVIAATSTHATNDAVWTGLREALGRWDGHDAADQLSAARTQWPPVARSRLDVLVHDLRMAEPLPPLPDFGESPKDVAAKVEAVLARYDGPPHYSEPNPDAAELAKLGRDAVPMLLSVLRAYGGDLGNGRFKAYVAADALALIGDERSVHAVGYLLAEGRSAAARVFQRPESSGALPALLVAVERDVLDSDVLDAIAAQKLDPHVDLTVLGWLERNPAGREVGSVAEFFSRRRFEDAVPALQAAIVQHRHPGTRVAIARSLASLGDPSGIDALVDIVEARGSTWARRTAGEALNEVVGRRVLLSDWGDQHRAPEGNFDAAAAEFREWWNANSGNLVFEREERRWRLPGDDGLGLPSSPPDVANRVRELLATFDGQHSFTTSDPRVGEIVDLGRDAVPQLLRELAESRRTGGFRHSAAADALAQLADVRDLPIMARLLARGRVTVAKCLDRLRSDAARDALLGAVERGFADYDVVDALGAYEGDRAVGDALVAWLRKYGAVDSSVGHVAEFVGRAGRDDALTPLRKIAAGRVDEHAQAKVAEAIAALGEKEGIEALVTMSCSTSDYASSAAAALNRIVGRHVYRGNVGWRATGGNLAEASAWFRAWWEEHRDRLEYDPVARSWSDGEDASAVDVGTSPPEVAARVAALLGPYPRRIGRNMADLESSVFGSRAANELAALGRDAIPALVARVRRDAPWDAHGDGSCRTAADALRLLRTDEDVELYVTLLGEGRLAMAVALRGCRDPRARSALLAVISRGFDDWDTLRALECSPPDAATWDAVRDWLRAPGAKSGFWLGRYLVAHATPEAAPVLREVLAADRVDSVLRAGCATALARIGERDGVEALLAMVDAEPFRADPRTWSSQDARSMAAEQLNAVFGERLVVDTEDELSQQDYADAAAGFRSWWAANGEALRFDRARNSWVRGVPPSAAPAPPAGELDAKVQALLADARDSDFFASFATDDVAPDRHAQALVALGRDALPSLVAAVRRGTPWGQGHDGNDVGAAEQALVALGEERDRETMLELLGEGRLAVAAWFRSYPSEQSRDALVAVVRRGFLTQEMLRALHPFRDEVPAQEAVADWAERFRETEFAFDDTLTAFLAAPAAGGTTPMLPDLLDRPIPASTRWRLAARMTEDGSVAAVAALVGMFTAPEALSDEAAAHVALILNRIAGDELVSVSAPNHAAPKVELGANPPRTIRLTSDPGRVRSRAEAAEAVRAWWTENGERLGFDAATGAWSIRR